MNSRAWYLYCVAAGDSPPCLEPGLEAVSHGRLHAVMGPVDPQAFAGLEPGPDGQLPEALAALLLQHDRVVRAAFATHPVLPMRFGTAFPDPGAALRLLQDRGAEFQTQLDRVRDHEEWGVKWPPPEPPTGPGPAPGAPARPSGLAYLQQQSRDLQARREADRRLRETVRRCQAELRHLASETHDTAYLVSRAKAAEFCKAAAEAGALLSGPWPPYSFCTTAPDQEHVPRGLT